MDVRYLTVLERVHVTSGNDSNDDTHTPKICSKLFSSVTKMSIHGVEAQKHFYVNRWMLHLHLQWN